MNWAIELSAAGGLVLAAARVGLAAVGSFSSLVVSEVVQHDLRLLRHGLGGLEVIAKLLTTLSFRNLRSGTLKNAYANAKIHETATKAHPTHVRIVQVVRVFRLDLHLQERGSVVDGAQCIRA